MKKEYHVIAGGLDQIVIFNEAVQADLDAGYELGGFSMTTIEGVAFLAQTMYKEVPDAGE